MRRLRLGDTLPYLAGEKMEIRASRRVDSLPGYAFKMIDDRVEDLRSMGVKPIDFGVGDPSTPTPPVVRTACQLGVDTRAASGYPSYVGAPEFREAVARWLSGRYGLDLDPGTEVASTVGSKEGIFNFHEALIDPGDLVLSPSPGYPPYSRGTSFAEGTNWFYPLDEDKGFLPDLDAIPKDVAGAAKLIWVNYPNSPCGVCPGLDFFERLCAWAGENEIIVASDEAYSELYFTDDPPPTVLQAGRDGVVVFNSLSKRSAMTCYRVGWVAGDARIIDLFKKVKTNIDSGTPTFVQDSAIAAMSDESHVEEMRSNYLRKRDILVKALVAAGLPRCEPEGSIYIWQKTPEGMSSIELTDLMMSPEVAIVATPGSLLSETVEGGRNPGDRHVRFALTPSLEDTEEAAERLSRLKL